MIDLLLGLAPLPEQPLIDYVTETKNEIKVEPELTVQEKIDQNYYKCDEKLEYIRKDNAKCIPRRVSRKNVSNIPSLSSKRDTDTQNIPETTTNKATAHSGWYSYGYCTAYVASRRSVGQWGDASSWVWMAQRDGWSTGSTPQVGAIAQKGNHVAYVESVSGNNMTISEANYQGWNVVSSRTIPISGWSFIY